MKLFQNRIKNSVSNSDACSGLARWSLCVGAVTSECWAGGELGGRRGGRTGRTLPDRTEVGGRRNGCSN